MQLLIHELCIPWDCPCVVTNIMGAHLSVYGAFMLDVFLSHMWSQVWKYSITFTYEQLCEKCAACIPTIICILSSPCIIPSLSPLQPLLAFPLSSHNLCSLMHSLFSPLLSTLTSSAQYCNAFHSFSYPLCLCKHSSPLLLPLFLCWYKQSTFSPLLPSGRACTPSSFHPP